jgi:signal transduction histidine kinase
MRLEKEALESQRPQHELVEVLRSLIHKLSQPLTSLRGSLEVALMGEMDEDECRRTLQQSLEETHRLAEVLGTLREVLEAEDPGEDFHPVSWKHLVARVLEDVAPVARGKGLRFVIEPMVDAYVKVNPPRVDAAMRELLQHLIGRGARKGVIRIGLSVQERTASLSVCNDGLPPDVAAPAEGSQLPASFTGALERTQLEWWILRRTIEGQGGWLEIAKITPRSVCCRIYLPLASSEAARPSSD